MSLWWILLLLLRRKTSNYSNLLKFQFKSPWRFFVRNSVESGPHFAFSAQNIRSSGFLTASVPNRSSVLFVHSFAVFICFFSCTRFRCFCFYLFLVAVALRKKQNSFRKRPIIHKNITAVILHWKIISIFSCLAL